MPSTPPSSSTTPAEQTVPLIAPPDNYSEPEKLTIDDVLQRHCGEFGLWQLSHFVFTSLAWAIEAFHAMVMIFADREPEWRCLTEECLVRGGLCGLEPGSWAWVGGLSGSTVAEWGLVCGEKYKVGLVQSFFFGGCMMGAGIFGHLSDSFLGRKGSLTIVCALNALFGCLTALSPNFWTYALLRLLTGVSTGGVGLCAFVLATEPVGPTKRGIAGMSTFYFFSTGFAILSGIAYVFRKWRSLYIATSIPSLLFLIFVLPFIPDSPRWYLIRGKIDKATEIMHSIAKTNGKFLPDNVTLALDEEANNSQEAALIKGQKGNVVLALDEEVNNTQVATLIEGQNGKITGSVIDVLRLPLTRVRLFLSVAINFLCSIVYYGLSLNVVNLGTNLYLNVCLNALAEMPAYLLTTILLNKFGRKPLAIGTLWFSGLFCLIGSLISGWGVWKIVRMVCGILGIFGMAGTYNLLFIYTIELFPTVVRSAALGCAAQAAHMGAIFSPFVVVLGGGFPFFVFGICGVAGGLFAFYLPETLNKPLYDTMAGMEEGENTNATSDMTIME